MTVPAVLSLNATDWGTNAVGPVTVLSGGRTVAANLVVTSTQPAMNALRNGTMLAVYGRGLDLLPAVLPIGPVPYNTTATVAIVWPAVSTL